MERERPGRSVLVDGVTCEGGRVAVLRLPGAALAGRVPGDAREPDGAAHAQPPPQRARRRAPGRPHLRRGAPQRVPQREQALRRVPAGVPRAPGPRPPRHRRERPVGLHPTRAGQPHAAQGSPPREQPLLRRDSRPQAAAAAVQRVVQPAERIHPGHAPHHAALGVPGDGVVRGPLGALSR